MNILHDVERPPEFGDWLCSCQGCLVAAEAAVTHNDQIEVVIKFASAPRVRVRLADVLHRLGGDTTEWTIDGPHQARPDRATVVRRWETVFDGYTEIPDDYVREVFIAEGGPVR